MSPNIARLSPTAVASVATAATAVPGDRRRLRTAATRSARRWSSMVLLEGCSLFRRTVRGVPPFRPDAGPGDAAPARVASRRPAYTAAMPGGRLRRVAMVLVAGAGLAAAGQVPASPDVVAARVMSLTRESVWTPVSATPVRFPTFHPQGMVKIGGVLFVSSVEVRTPTRRFPARVDGFDRDPGAGVGHLFKMDATGAPPRRHDAGRGADLPSRRHRLRRPQHLGARRRVPPGQPIDRLPRRSRRR